MNLTQFNPIALAATVVGGLLVAALLGWVRKPRLIVLVPRSFSYSQITDRGQLVEISIFNRGFKTEEAVELTLNHGLRYELLGSNSQDANVTSNKVVVPRIGPSDEVTVLLLVEGGTFKKDDIVQCLSKENKGQLVSKLDEVTPTGPQRISIVGMFVAVPALLYGLTFLLDAVSSYARTGTISTAPDSRAPLDVGGWQVPWFQIDRSPLLSNFKDGKISVTVGSVSKKGDIASIPLRFSNQSAEVLKATATVTSARSASRFKSHELTLDDIVLIQGKPQDKLFKVVIPEGSTIVGERTAFIEVSLSTMDGKTLSFKRQLEVQ
jgi:hypothetical protein